MIVGYPAMTARALLLATFHCAVAKYLARTPSGVTAREELDKTQDMTAYHSVHVLCDLSHALHPNIDTFCDLFDPVQPISKSLVRSIRHSRLAI